MPIEPTHTSTSVSSFELMFGRQPKDHTEGQTGYAVDEYQGTMQAKLAELMDFVETHMVDAARHQKQEYDKHMGIRTFKAGDLVWLSIPTAGKLDPRWEGGWKVKACKSPVNMERIMTSLFNQRNLSNEGIRLEANDPQIMFKLEDKLREGSDECNLGDLMNGEEELY
ncbi:hypothetical protein EMCRGX_G007512 [Ephydatia muelleri]